MIEIDFGAYEMTYSKQCVLQNGPTTQVAFIPESFAKVGKFLRIGDENGWQVKEVGTRLSDNYIQSHEREYLNHRKVTDI